MSDYIYTFYEAMKACLNDGKIIARVDVNAKEKFFFTQYENNKKILSENYTGTESPVIANVKLEDIVAKWRIISYNVQKYTILFPEAIRLMKEEGKILARLLMFNAEEEMIYRYNKEKELFECLENNKWLEIHEFFSCEILQPWRIAEQSQNTNF